MEEEGDSTGFEAIYEYWKSNYETKVDFSIDPCIFRIPPILRMKNPQAYAPFEFSFGPWHSNKQGTVAAEKHKASSLLVLLRRFQDSVSKIQELEQVVENEADRACQSYGGWEEIGVTREEFKKILLLDGCFIIEMLRKKNGLIHQSHGDLILFSNAMSPTFCHDLFLMENQIPWFVLELLYEHTRVSEGIHKSLAQLFVDVYYWIFSYEKIQFQPDELACKEIKHILHLVWHYLGSSPEKGSSDFRRNKHNVSSATRLHEAGVKFKKVESRRILDVRFNADDGVLEIPTLLIFPATETIFRNLICFEQCSAWYPAKVTCYAKLLDGLVDDAEDVSLLSTNDVFNNWLNPEDVAHFVNKLHDGTNMDVWFYADLSNQVDAYCHRLWPRWRAFYIKNYFAKPWAIVSQAFAIIVLVLTILQVYHL